MRLIHTARFEKDYSAAPTDVQRAFDKQERFLADNLQCTSSNQSGPLRLRRKRDFLPLCRVVRRPLILSPSCS